MRLDPFNLRSTVEQAARAAIDWALRDLNNWYLETVPQPTRSSMPSSTGAIDLSALSTEEREQIDKLAEQHGTSSTNAEPESSTPEADTAFLVLITNGQVAIAPANTSIRLVREPHNDDFFSAAAIIQKDILAAETSNATIQTQLQAAMQMRQQQEAQQLAARLQQPGGGLRG